MIVYGAVTSHFVIGNTPNEKVVSYMFMEFLYFPQDKSEYIPAFITLVIFMIGAIATMYLFYKKSKKDEKYFDEKYNLGENKKPEEEDYNKLQ